MRELNEVIAEATIRAFNAGYQTGLDKALTAAKFVSFGHSDFESDILALSDFEEEVKGA
jgi:hypothetical protein